MKLRHQIYIYQIIFSIILFSVLFFTYSLYQKQYQKDINDYVNKEIKLHQKEIISSINKANLEFKKQKKLFYDIHEEALAIVKKDINVDLEELKRNLKKKYNLKNIDIEIYLIDSSYTIYKTTYPKDLGFNLSVAADAKDFLDKTSIDGKIYVSDFASTDSLNMNYKLYSYSRLNDTKYFELGFTDKQINNSAMSIINQYLTNKQVKIYNVGKNNKGYYYYDMVKSRDIKNKELFFNSLKITKKQNIKDNVFTNAALNFEQNLKMEDTKLIIHSPIFQKNMYDILGFENVVMRLTLDLSEKLQFIENIEKIFLISTIIIIIFLLSVFIFIKKRFTYPIEKILNSLQESKKIEDKKIINLNNELSEISIKYNNLFDRLNEEIVLNSNLLEENKRFIADTVHQIRTPLTNIMMNGEMIKQFQNDEILINFIDQIDASINMLSNSYEDLAYITTYDSISYKSSIQSISKIINKRIKFFNTIAKVNLKDIENSIENSIEIFINQVELERLIDNNISNGIKYADIKKPITINLYKKHNKTILEFKTYGKEIKSKQKVFEKNYRENESKRGFGLGLNMVRKICEKYNISYKLYYENNQNVFEYTFKSD